MKTSKTDNVRMKLIVKFFRATIVAVESNNYYTFRVCVTLVIQDSKRMSPIILSSIACMVLPHFSVYLIKYAIFGKKWLNFIFSTILSEIFLTLRRIQRYIIINVHRSSCKVTVILVRFLIKLEFPWEIFEVFRYQILWTSLQLKPSCSMRTDRQAWRT
jgi:hypothetical protein